MEPQYPRPLSVHILKYTPNGTKVKDPKLPFAPWSINPERKKRMQLVGVLTIMLNNLEEAPSQSLPNQSHDAWV
jgi:hypothetical protein